MIPLLLQWLKKIPLAKAGPAAGFLVALGAVVIIGYRLRWWQTLAHTLGLWFWLLLFIIVVAVLIGGLLWFVARYRRQRFLQGLRAGDTTTPQDTLQESYQHLQENLQEALRTLREAPALRRQQGGPLYAIPWYLLLGASGSGKTAMLQSVAQNFAPFARPTAFQEGPTQDCSWWFFNTAIILDTPGIYAFPTETELEGTQWYRFLCLLRQHRPLQPLNGVVLAVAADALVNRRPEAWRAEASELRKRIDELTRMLGVTFPVYLLITHCDLLEGFTEFVEQLPPHTRQQVFGYLYEAPASGQQAAPAGQFLEVFSGLVARLQQLRLAFFNGEHILTGTVRQKLFCFPEEFRALQEPLNVLVDTLKFDTPFRHPLFLRGIFFSSAQQRGTPVSCLRQEFHLNGQCAPLAEGNSAYFLQDFLADVLSRDRYYVETTREARRGRFLRQLFGVGGLCALGLAGALFLLQNIFSDRWAQAAVDPRHCVVASDNDGAPSQPRLADTDRCRREVQELSRRNAERPGWRRMVFKKSFQLEQFLRQRYVEKFALQVLTPIDTYLARRLRTGDDAVPLAFLLIARIELLKRCLTEAGCPRPLTPEWQSEYALMAQAAPDDPEAQERLELTYQAYLLWASGNQLELRQEQEALITVLQEWLRSRQFALRQIIAWVNQHFEPVIAAPYWAVLASHVRPSTAKVDGAYTHYAWEKRLAPFLARAQEAMPEIAGQIADFQRDYRIQYFSQWARFLEAFPRDTAVLASTLEQRRQVVLLFLDTERSPYNQIIDVAVEHLAPFLPAAVDEPQAPSDATPPSPPAKAPQARDPDVPMWSLLLQEYVSSPARGAYLAALQGIRQQLDRAAFAEQSFELTRASFQHRSLSADSPVAFLQAWGILRNLQEQAGAGATEVLLWPLLERPLRFLWEVILAESGLYLQKRWQENILLPIQELTNLERIDMLYGKEGRVRQFAEFVKPFLTEDETHVGQLLGGKLPLSAGFLKALGEEKHFRPIVEVGRHKTHHVKVQAIGKSVITGRIGGIEDEATELVLTCTDKPYRITNQGTDFTKQLATVPWSFDSCSDVVMTITMSCNRACVDGAAITNVEIAETASLQLRKVYEGQEGFRQFVEDFQDGVQTFAVNDFATSYEPSVWRQQEAVMRSYTIRSVAVRYRVTIPPTLEKLLALMSETKLLETIVQ